MMKAILEFVVKIWWIWRRTSSRVSQNNKRQQRDKIRASHLGESFICSQENLSREDSLHISSQGFHKELTHQ